MLAIKLDNALEAVIDNKELSENVMDHYRDGGLIIGMCKCENFITILMRDGSLYVSEEEATYLVNPDEVMEKLAQIVIGTLIADRKKNNHQSGS